MTFSHCTNLQEKYTTNYTTLEADYCRRGAHQISLTPRID